MQDDPKMAALARVPLFAHCSKRDLAQIARIADEIDFPAGKTLTKEGSPGREFFVILEGEVDVRQNSRLLRARGSGDFIGEIALLTGKARTATVTTVTPVRAVVIVDRAFRELLRGSPEIQGKVLEAVADRLAASAALF
ncbi:MAG TPA: cyclic nucleotide-binding domain-containing protein [Gaiellaceae bacterium]|nr:cyclic nucleotide-binding domain-containing protein [Gaiellaceae bacterium]